MLTRHRHQYFYKSSKTHLTNGRTEDKEEPVFTFNEVVQPTARSTLPPAQADYPLLPSNTRASRFSTLQPQTQTYARSYTPAERSLLRNGSWYESEEFPEHNSAMYDRKFRLQQGLMDAQEKRIQEQDVKLQALSNQLDLFKRIVQDLQFTVSKVQARSTDVVTLSPDPEDFVGKLEHLVTAMKKSRSRSQGTREHVHNASLNESASLSPKPGQNNEISVSLGKRKRNSNVARNASLPRATHTDDLGLATARLETTSRSLSFADSSQNSDESSRNSQEESTATSFLSNDAPLDAPTPSHQKTPRPTQLPTRRSTRRKNAGQEHHAPDVSITDITSFVSANDKGHIEFSDNDMETSAGAAGDTNNTNNRNYKTGSNAFISNQDTSFLEPQCPGVLEEPDHPQTGSIASVPLADIEGELQNARKKPRRAQSCFTAVPDSATERGSRSLAPEPTTRRRTLPRTMPSPEVGGIDLDNVCISTPASMENQQLDVPKKSPKPVLQSTEKILNLELKELGLEEWIGKDKQNNAEYRKAIGAARAKKREENKRAKLVTLGFTTAAFSDDPPQSDPVSTPAEEPLLNSTQAPQPSAEVEDTQAIAEVSSAHEPPSTKVVNEINEINDTGAAEAEARLLAALVGASTVRTLKGESVGPADPSKPVQQTPGVRTRRKGREAELRRRSQLAQQAMEMET